MILKIFKCVVAGCLVGLAFVLPLFFGAHLPRWLMAFLNTINAPALWLAHMWSYDFRLPPGGEAGKWVIVPFVMVLLQWGLIGLLVGLIWTSSKEKSATPATQSV